jgi:hypothetical protein
MGFEHVAPAVHAFARAWPGTTKTRKDASFILISTPSARTFHIASPTSEKRRYHHDTILMIDPPAPPPIYLLQPSMSESSTPNMSPTIFDRFRLRRRDVRR